MLPLQDFLLLHGLDLALHGGGIEVGRVDVCNVPDDDGAVLALPYGDHHVGGSGSHICHVPVGCFS